MLQPKPDMEYSHTPKARHGVLSENQSHDQYLVALGFSVVEVLQQGWHFSDGGGHFVGKLLLFVVPSGKRRESLFRVLLLGSTQMNWKRCKLQVELGWMLDFAEVSETLVSFWIAGISLGCEGQLALQQRVFVNINPFPDCT